MASDLAFLFKTLCLAVVITDTRLNDTGMKILDWKRIEMLPDAHKFSTNVFNVVLFLGQVLLNIK